MTQGNELNRRVVLTGACALLALGGVGALPASAEVDVQKSRKGRIKVRLKSIPELSKVGGSVGVGNVRGTPVAIARTGESTYIAFSLSCPHQGVKVSRVEEGWECSAHGSQFEADGDLVLGPATTRLRRVPIKVSRGIATVG
jgi:Rieske Fe-S protein